MAVEIEKTKLDGERILLNEKSITVEKMLLTIKSSDQDQDRLKLGLKAAELSLIDMQKERDDAVYKSRELQLQVLTQQHHESFEFEIQSLKRYCFF